MNLAKYYSTTSPRACGSRGGPFAAGRISVYSEHLFKPEGFRACILFQETWVGERRGDWEQAADIGRRYLLYAYLGTELGTM